jgi:protein-disulfide isomerase
MSSSTHLPARAARFLPWALEGALVGALSLALATGCGGATATTTTNANRAPAAGARLEVAPSPLRVTLATGVVIAMDEAGLITIDGEPLGTLRADGRIVDVDGETLSALIPDGQISHRGQLVPARIAGDRLSADGDRGYLALAPPDRLEERLESGEVLAGVPVVGLTESNHATFLFVLATALLEGSRPPSGGERGDEAEEGDDEVAAVDAGPPVLRVPVDNAPQRGPADALVTIVIFSDFQCPFCSRVTPTLERIEQTYGHDVRLVFRHNPLPFHADAMPAAEAAMEAYAQRGPVGFWTMHDLLFENQRALDRASLEQYAAQVGLDLARFRMALDGHVHQAAIAADQQLATQLGARGTPSFFINGRSLVGAQPFEAFQAAVDAARDDARARISRGTARARVYDQILAEGRTAAPPPPARPAPARSPEDDPTRRWAIGDGRGSPARGPRGAPITIQVFSDFQCPFCARAVPTMERVLETYGQRVRFVFRQYPLPFHRWAQDAAELSLEVRAQRGDDGFWELHDLLFENQALVNDADDQRAALVELAGRVRGVDVRRARRALDEGRHRAAVQADMDAIQSAGASIGTPSFFVNGLLIQGAQPFERFQALIDDELSQ